MKQTNRGWDKQNTRTGGNVQNAQTKVVIDRHTEVHIEVVPTKKSALHYFSFDIFGSNFGFYPQLASWATKWIYSTAGDHPSHPPT